MFYDSEQYHQSPGHLEDVISQILPLLHPTPSLIFRVVIRWGHSQMFYDSEQYCHYPGHLVDVISQVLPLLQSPPTPPTLTRLQDSH